MKPAEPKCKCGKRREVTYGNEIRCFNCGKLTQPSEPKKAICSIHGEFSSGFPKCPICKEQEIDEAIHHDNVSKALSRHQVGTKSEPSEPKGATMDEILEKVFNRGYHHGVSGGQSDDGETYAVSDAKTAIRQYIRGKVEGMVDEGAIVCELNKQQEYRDERCNEFTIVGKAYQARITKSSLAYAIKQRLLGVKDA